MGVGDITNINLIQYGQHIFSILSGVENLELEPGTLSRHRWLKLTA